MKRIRLHAYEEVETVRQYEVPDDFDPIEQNADGMSHLELLWIGQVPEAVEIEPHEEAVLERHLTDITRPGTQPEEAT